MKNFNFAIDAIGLAIVLLLTITAPLIWKWSKYGIYGLIILFFVWLIEYYFYELPGYLLLAKQTNTLPVVRIIESLWMYLTYSTLYFFALKRKWHLFSI